MSKKYKKLLLGILFDCIGMLSFIFPVIGEYSDIVWAPISAFVIYKMYGGTVGKVGGLISLIEEAGILGTDLIPTFTLTWIYKYILKK